MNEHRSHNPELPEDLRGLEASLDALGEQTRASAPADLGQRIADAGVETITSPSRGHLRLTGTNPDPVQLPAWRQHWRMAASIALLAIAVVAAISQSQQQPATGPIATTNTETNPDPDVITGIDDDWVEFETEYVADTSWDNSAFETLATDLDDLELSFNTAWTLDENLNLNEGESL